MNEYSFCSKEKDISSLQIADKCNFARERPCSSAEKVLQFGYFKTRRQRTDRDGVYSPDSKS